jgi:hypothetical protein
MIIFGNVHHHLVCPNKVHVPFLCLVAGNEKVVDPNAHVSLMAKSSTTEEHKKVVVYPEVNRKTTIN